MFDGEQVSPCKMNQEGFDFGIVICNEGEGSLELSRRNIKKKDNNSKQSSRHEIRF